MLKNDRFLLARIYLNLLSFKISVTEIRNQLGAFQRSDKHRGTGNAGTPLADAYKQTMERINGQQPEHAMLAKKLLLWIAFARRELKVVELQHALATGHEPGPIHDQDLPFVERMIAVCAGLVTIDEKTDVIRLVHFTTQEYINQQPDQLLPMTEQYITRTCLNYISLSGLRILDGDPWSVTKDFLKQVEYHPFYNYAAQNWGHHARDSPILRQELESFALETEVHTSANILILTESLMNHLLSSRMDRQDLKSFTKLHAAAYFGLADLVEDLIRVGFEIDRKDCYGRTPLSYSAALGWETTVSLLLNAGAEMDSQAVVLGLNAIRTPLRYDAGVGYDGITRILIRNGASSELLSSQEYDSIMGLQPLSCTVRSGYDGILHHLFDKYNELDYQDQD